MNSLSKFLVLAGAREAHDIVARLSERGHPVLASLPEPERTFAPLPVETRIGRFGSGAEMRDWMARQAPRAVIDAGHAFEGEVSTQAAEACATLGLPYLRLLREPWAAQIGDRWIRAADVPDAAARVPPGARVFSNTGRASQGDYAGFRGQVLFLRQTEERGASPPFGFLRYDVSQPPYTRNSELELFRKLRIDVLICRNVGGTDSIAKVRAARALGLQVIMIARPAPPTGAQVVTTVAEAMNWAASL